MNISGKMIGIMVLVAFTLMAGSVVCLASGQPSVMGGCENGMGSAAMCPFMSVSVPAVVNISSVIEVLSLVVALFLVAGSTLKSSSENVYAEKFFAMAHERMRDSATGRRSDVVLNLISDGILHSRVFGF